MINGTLATAAPNNKKLGNSRSLLLIAALSALFLAGCASRSSNAPIADYSNGTGAASSTQAAKGTYIIKPGDTLYKIAQQHGISVASLSKLNNITDPTQLAVGQVLRLDSVTALPVNVGSSSTASSSSSSSSSTSASSSTATSTSTSAARASDANLISWAWPINGKIIQGFNSNTKGIDIAGTTGDPVLAAADGKVMYAGNGVRGLGNLILLGHSNGFITAYAHNQELLVKTGASIKKGAKIATVGQSDTSSPRLHFEIRRKGTPVNPLSYLPAK